MATSLTLPPETLRDFVDLTNRHGITFSIGFSGLEISGLEDAFAKPEFGTDLKTFLDNHDPHARTFMEENISAYLGQASALTPHILDSIEDPSALMEDPDFLKDLAQQIRDGNIGLEAVAQIHQIGLDEISGIVEDNVSERLEAGAGGEGLIAGFLGRSIGKIAEPNDIPELANASGLDFGQLISSLSDNDVTLSGDHQRATQMVSSALREAFDIPLSQNEEGLWRHNANISDKLQDGMDEYLEGAYPYDEDKRTVMSAQFELFIAAQDRLASEGALATVQQDNIALISVTQQGQEWASRILGFFGPGSVLGGLINNFASMLGFEFDIHKIADDMIRDKMPGMTLQSFVPDYKPQSNNAAQNTPSTGQTNAPPQTTGNTAQRTEVGQLSDVSFNVHQGGQLAETFNIAGRDVVHNFDPSQDRIQVPTGAQFDGFSLGQNGDLVAAFSEPATGVQHTVELDGIDGNAPQKDMEAKPDGTFELKV